MTLNKVENMRCLSGTTKAECGSKRGVSQELFDSVLV